MKLLGVHHVTAITSQASRNHRFYTETLGMRLVKRSVNQDDVSAYHLYYADAVGTAGTSLTFFDWPMAAERRGTRSIVRTSLRVAGAGTLEWWRRRLEGKGVTTGTVVERLGRPTLEFEDFEGQRLALVDDFGEGPDPEIWADSSVPPERQIRGFGPVTLSVPGIDATARILTHVMGMRPAEAAGEGDLHVFEMSEGGPHAEVHVVVEPGGAPARQGAGAVHHVAFRTPDEAQHERWAERLDSLGIPNSGRVDRYYFRSLYFREPNGILFEIATDGPGFTVDEPSESLGESIALPPFLESRREAIEAGLTPLA